MILLGIRQTCFAQKRTLSRAVSTTFFEKNFVGRQYHLRCNRDHHFQINESSVLCKQRYLRHCTSKTLSKTIECGFKTSSTNRVHPLLLTLLKPISRIVTMIAGRKIRKWWRNKSESDKLKFRKYFIKEEFGDIRDRYIVGGKFKLIISIIGAFNYLFRLNFSFHALLFTILSLDV